MCSLSPPPSRSAKAAANLLEIVDTVTDGNCGLHAFLKSAPAPLRNMRSGNWARVSWGRNSGGDPAAFKVMRGLALEWVRKNSAQDLWEGTTIADIIRATTGSSLDMYLDRMGKSGSWVDTVFLHALACSFGVDVIVFQEGMEPGLLGASLGGVKSLDMLPVALANDHHFWAMQPAEVVAPVVNKGDMFLAGTVVSPAGAVVSQAGCSKRAQRPGPNAQHPQEDDSEFVEWTPSLDETLIDAELTLCNVLLQWSPFASPKGDVIEAMTQLGTLGRGLPCKRRDSDVVLARQLAIGQLASESEALQAHATPKRRAACAHIAQAFVRVCAVRACVATRRRRCRARSVCSAPRRTCSMWGP